MFTLYNSRTLADRMQGAKLAQSIVDSRTLSTAHIMRQGDTSLLRRSF